MKERKKESAEVFIVVNKEIWTKNNIKVFLIIVKKRLIKSNFFKPIKFQKLN
jgi:hypothetical protein